MVASTMSLTENERATQNTMKYYDKIVKPQTGMTITELLEHVMYLEGINDANDWFTNNFAGVLSEKPVKGREDEIDYRAWTQLNKVNKETNLLLPILTAPQEDMYIITMPSQFVIGSMNRYSSYVNGDTEKIKCVIEEYATMIGNFYSTSSSFINNSADILNKKVHIQYDTRFNFPAKASQQITPGRQDKGTSQDPVIKWVYEAVDRFAIEDGSGAYANGTDVYWVANAALNGGTYPFKVFSHETAHNQDGYYFYEGYGRRQDTWAEDHADGNIAQDLDDGSFVFNIRNDFDVEADISNNLTLDRINSKEKIYSYYKEMFETHYVLDYLTAQAILRLTPEQQVNLITQVNYTDDSNPSDGGKNTEHTKLTVEQIKAMNLKTIEDLYNNRIVFRDAGKSTGENPGRYGGDNHYNIYWYQPYNDNGRTDSYSFKRVGFELLGVAGYTNGYVAYRSGMTKNDLEALRIATGDEDITWKEYKLGRFENVKNNLDNIPYFDANEVINLYEKALIKDSQAGNRTETNNIRRVLYGMVKRATGDFTNSSVYQINNVVTITSAQQFIDAVETDQMGYFQLANDIDFTDIDITGKEGYISTAFLGTLDGNGYKFTGLKLPLFTKTTYANIKDVVIDSPMYTSAAKASLIVEAKNSMIEDLTINNINATLPTVYKITGSLQNLGEVNSTQPFIEISSFEDLVKIDNNATGLEKKMNYKLMNDIDASSSVKGEYIIKGEFLGELDGNGHKIYNLNGPLFENLKGKVYNLTIEDFKMYGYSNALVGALAGQTNNAVVEDIKMSNIAVEGRDKVGSLVGMAKASTFNRISITNIDVYANLYYAGGLIGRTFDSHISDVYIQGKMRIKQGTHNGGLIGSLNRDTIERVYLDVDITTSLTNKNGGLFGNAESTPINIKDIVVVSDVSDTLYKVTSAVDDREKNYIASGLKNIYEAKNSTGISNISEGNDIKSLEDTMLQDENFYKNNLNWSDSIWDFSGVSLGEAPKIK